MNAMTESDRTIAAALLKRESELRVALNTEADSIAHQGGDAGEVKDFKDLAASESLTTVDAIQGAHAADELEQVTAALRRLQEGRYGVCVDCGVAIQKARLEALPAAPRCTACQALRERTH